MVVYVISLQTLLFLKTHLGKFEYQLVWAGKEVVGDWTLRLPLLLTPWQAPPLPLRRDLWGPNAIFPSQKPPSKVLSAAALLLSPSPLSRETLPRRGSSLAGVLWDGGKSSRYLWLINPSMNSPECHGTSKWSQFSLGIKFPSCLSVLWPHAQAQSSPARKPSACVVPSLFLLSLLMLEIANTFFFQQIHLFLPSATLPVMLSRTCTGSSLKESFKTIPVLHTF